MRAFKGANIAAARPFLCLPLLMIKVIVGTAIIFLFVLCTYNPEGKLTDVSLLKVNQLCSKLFGALNIQQHNLS